MLTLEEKSENRWRFRYAIRITLLTTDEEFTKFWSWCDDRRIRIDTITDLEFVELCGTIPTAQAVEMRLRWLD